MASAKLLNLISKRLSTFWETTRDMIAQVPDSLPEIVSEADDYLEEVPGQIAAAAGKQADDHRTVFLRIAVELFVLKISRLIPSYLR